MFKIKNLIKAAKKKNKTIVFPEASFSERTIAAAKILQKQKIVRVLLVGDASALVLQDKTLEKFEIVSPATFADRDKLVKTLLAKRKDKGMTQKQAEELANDPYYFATLLVECGYADGMIAGAEASTATTIRPALQIIKGKNKKDPISSFFLFYGKNKFLGDKTLILSDCAVLENPTSEELACIAKQSAISAAQFGIDPKVAFLSYSSKGSAKSENVSKVQKAFELFKKKEKDIICDGELQFDAAMVKSVASKKCPQSPLAGDANVLVFPDLEAGNICYKAMQYTGGLNAVGPILQGLKKPVNDLSRGCVVEDIIAVAAITALQCE